MPKSILNQPTDNLDDDVDQLLQSIREKNIAKNKSHRRPGDPLPPTQDRIKELTEYYTSRTRLDIRISKEMDKFGDRWGIAGTRIKPNKKKIIEMVYLVDVFDDLDTNRLYYEERLIRFKEEK